MKNKYLLMLGLLFSMLATASSSFAANWVYYGLADEYTFYDENSVTKNRTNHTVTVMTEKISLENLLKFGKTPEISAKAASMLADGYVPKLLKIDAIHNLYDNDQAMEGGRRLATQAELTANNTNVTLSSLVQVQIDCKGKRVKPLKGNLYEKDGTIKAEGDMHSSFASIPPGSITEYLSLLVCP